MPVNLGHIPPNHEQSIEKRIDERMCVCVFVCTRACICIYVLTRLM